MMQNNIKNKKGFTAVIAVILISTGIIALSVMVIGRAAAYGDMVNKREMRIRKSLALSACLTSLEIMAAKDILLIGSVIMEEFQCEGYIEKDPRGQRIFSVKSI